MKSGGVTKTSSVTPPLFIIIDLIFFLFFFLFFFLILRLISWPFFLWVNGELVEEAVELFTPSRY